MTRATVEQPASGKVAGKRSLHRRLGLWVAVVLAFGVQIGLVFLVGNPPPVKPFQPPVPPVIHVDSNGTNALLALQDPTLFILPHLDNFSGAGWMKFTPPEFASTNWSEPARPLELATEQLGATFVAYMQTTQPPQFQPHIESGLIEGGPGPMAPLATPSTMRVEGDLARLRLLTPVHLPPQTNADVLTNSVVQLLVDGRGFPFSPVILAGDPSVDASSLLNFVKTLRFAPALSETLKQVPADKVTEGKLVFEWHTVPPAPTNATPAAH
ncbi:MAG TPA: hypothetical protein VN873_01515 [Candidatus Angelobacter sp.]|nr:hypothetical protein [Candidatus Angelobacter sp.]